MSLTLSSIRPPVNIPSIELPSTGKTGTAGAFQSVLSGALNQVQQTQNHADATVGKFLSGENQEVHQVAMAVTENELAFNMFMQVRNKVVSAYQEVMRMQM